ncbi:MAG TPA: alpha-galactosidase, partial [Clostridia bacterium]|nr:alpha-galactosidase [Clostridia bacterium]
TGYVPLVMLHADKSDGVYIGWEWGEGHIHVAGRQKGDALYAGIAAGLDIQFCTEVQSGEEFIVPNAFIGAFSGSLDDASNRLRKWLFNYMMPEINRTNENLPLVQWNAFHSTAISPGSWIPVESKYYPMVDSIVKVGIEEVTIDVGWWQNFGDYRGHAERWPRGMAAASQYAHDHGMSFTLYFAFLDDASEHPLAFSSKHHPEWISGRWGCDMGIDECRDFMKGMVLQRLNEYNVDTIRTDLSPIARLKAPGNKHQGCNDGPYWAQRGFLHFMDHLLTNRPGLRYQNCNCGPALCGYEIMKRSSVIQSTDGYTALDARRTVWDLSYCFPMMQLMVMFGDVVTERKLGLPSYRFRTYLMCAPCAHIELPDEMEPHEMQAMARMIETYKRRIRPLVRRGDVYHVLPRPDGVNWDGLQLYNPESGKGMLSVFRPDSDVEEMKVRLKGLDENAQYIVEYDDGTLANTTVSGRSLMAEGVPVKLRDRYSAEWVFIARQ